jgi:hypothetical protein
MGGDGRAPVSPLSVEHNSAQQDKASNMDNVTIPLPRPVSWHQSHELYKGFSKRGENSNSKAVTIRFLPEEYEKMVAAANALSVNHGNYIRQVVTAVSEVVLLGIVETCDDPSGSG